VQSLRLEAIGVEGAPVSPSRALPRSRLGTDAKNFDVGRAADFRAVSTPSR
jgi:hypothetical protein